MTGTLGWLCGALASARVTVSADAGVLRARPAAAVTPTIAAGLRKWKPELYRLAVRTADPVTPHPCALCGCEAVLADGEQCPWCRVIGSKLVRLPPMGAAELSFWDAMPHPEKSLPKAPHPHSGSIGELGDSPSESRGMRMCVRGVSGNAPNCSPDAPRVQLDLEVA